LKGLPAVVALLVALTGAAQAQTADNPDQVVARWAASNTTCRNPSAAAADAVGACEQRDTLSKVLALANYCHGSTDKAGPPRWMPCARAPRDAGLTRATALFQRVGGVFVLPALLNGTTQAYFIVDSGAATVQIPEEAADAMKRAGTLSEADFMGQHRFILADGRYMQQRLVRLRALQIGDRTMDNVLATVGAPRTRALLGQTFLQRLNWWKIDNVRNAIEFEFTGAF
jgi:clan AA aspartic protease (TIGR02281 family)